MYVSTNLDFKMIQNSTWCKKFSNFNFDSLWPDTVGINTSSTSSLAPMFSTVSSAATSGDAMPPIPVDGRLVFGSFESPPLMIENDSRAHLLPSINITKIVSTTTIFSFYEDRENISSVEDAPYHESLRIPVLAFDLSFIVAFIFYMSVFLLMAMGRPKFRVVNRVIRALKWKGHVLLFVVLFPLYYAVRW